MNLLVSWLIEGIGLAVVATIVARFIPAGSPAQRHAFWWLALAGMLVLPFMPGVVLSNAAALGSASTTVASRGSAWTVPAPPPWLPLAALGAWVALALVSLTRLVLNLLAVQRLAREARPLPLERINRFVQFTEAQSGSRPARVCVSDAIRGACAVGFFKPSIMLSWDLVAALDDDAIEAIVLHEYAHLQRYDDWTRLLQQFVLCLAGVHPGVRWASRQIDIEREASCDRLVVVRTGAPVYYARSLAAAAEISSRMSGLTPIAAPGAPMSGRGLHARVARVLATVPVRPTVAWGSAGAGAAAVVLATAASAGLPPMIIVASLERPILALASVPWGPGTIGQLPTAAMATFAEPDPDEATAPVASDNTVTQDEGAATIASIPAAAVSIEPPYAASIPREEPAPAPVPVATVPASAAALAPEPQAPLASVLLPPAIHSPKARAPRVSLDRPREVSGIGVDIGLGAARLGVVTGDVAARAGTSIGRFFKNGGLAIASGVLAE